LLIEPDKSCINNKIQENPLTSNEGSDICADQTFHLTE
jgi:hypothetical protein